ncbi:sodium channel subunit beta-4 [Ambystoma mexicanum]|uniref:sodium channel subunit beta-4 n=1 Tax=Ambystoma mexicanum TaxID=8296 RepID=UPI0037E8F24D
MAGPAGGSASDLGPAWSGALLVLLGLHFFPGTPALEVSVGKTGIVTAKNGTDVLLPCTFATCIGFENAIFKWTYNSTDAYNVIYSGTIKNKQSNPKTTFNPDPQIELAASNNVKDYNISIIVRNVQFENEGKYTCYVVNPKEKDAKHNATLQLIVVDKFVVVDNTLTVIIAGSIGGLIGLLILIFILKKIILFAIQKSREKKKDYLVNSSGNDNTEVGSKTPHKA